MEARDRMWEELKQAKTNIICLQRYTDRGRKRHRIADSIIAVCAIVVLFGDFYNKWITISGVLVVMSVLVLKLRLQGASELSELDRLWYDCDNDIISESEMIHAMFEIKEKEYDKYSLLNKGVRSISKKEQSKIDAESTEYFYRICFSEYKKNNE